MRTVLQLFMLFVLLGGGINLRAQQETEDDTTRSTKRGKNSGWR